MEEIFKALMEKGEIYEYLSRNPIPLVGEGELSSFLREYELVFIYFTAEWCSPCIRLLPELAKASLKARKARAKIVRVDVDRSHSLANKYRIERLPSLLVARKGRIIDSVTGTPAPGALRSLIESYVEGLKK